MKHVIACREPGGTNPDRWVMIAGEPGNWGEPSRPIYRAGTIEDAINGLIQARFRHDLALTEEPFRSSEQITARGDRSACGDHTFDELATRWTDGLFLNLNWSSHGAITSS